VSELALGVEARLNTGRSCNRPGEGSCERPGVLIGDAMLLLLLLLLLLLGRVMVLAVPMVPLLGAST
jgi:hypothetical protein